MGAEIITVRVGDLLLGVRTNDEAVTERLRALLGPAIDDSAAAPPNLSLVIGAVEPGSPVRALHTLHRGGQQQLATPSLGRLLRAVPAQLDAYLAPVRDLHRLRAAVLVGERDVVLVHHRFDDLLTRAQARLARAGYRLADLAGADLDPQGDGIVFRAPAVGFVAEEEATLDLDFPATERETRVAEGLLPLKAVVVPDPPLAGGMTHPARRLASLVSLLDERSGAMDPPGLDALAALEAAGRVHFRTDLTDRDLLGLVAGEAGPAADRRRVNNVHGQHS